MLIMGDLYFDSKDFVNAATLFYYAIRTGIFTREFTLQCRALQSLAKVLSMMVFRQLSLSCFFKALEYALHFDDLSSELAIYHQLSKLYFEANDLKRAVYFHRKVIDGNTEKSDSVLRFRAKQETDKFINSCSVYKSDDYFQFFDLVLSLNESHVQMCRLISIVRDPVESLRLAIRKSRIEKSDSGVKIYDPQFFYLVENLNERYGIIEPATEIEEGKMRLFEKLQADQYFKPSISVVPGKPSITRSGLFSDSREV